METMYTLWDELPEIVIRKKAEMELMFFRQMETMEDVKFADSLFLCTQGHPIPDVDEIEALEDYRMRYVDETIEMFFDLYWNKQALFELFYYQTFEKATVIAIDKGKGKWGRRRIQKKYQKKENKLSNGIRRRKCDETVEAILYLQRKEKRVVEKIVHSDFIDIQIEKNLVKLEQEYLDQEYEEYIDKMFPASYWKEEEISQEEYDALSWWHEPSF